MAVSVVIRSISSNPNNNQVMSVMLPFDVVAMVLDHFEGQRADLKHFSLVCKGWLLPSRHRLFRMITLKMRPDRDEVTPFRAFLESPRGGDCARYVLALCVQGRGTESHWEPTLDLHVLGAIVHRLPRLQVFSVDQVRFEGLPGAGPRPPTCESVEHVGIARMTTWQNHDVKACLDLLHLFPRLKHLRTDDLGRMVENTVTTRVHPYPPPKDHLPFAETMRLDSLELRAFGPTLPVLQYALRAWNLSALTQLDLWHILPEELELLGAFLAEVKGTLQWLYLNITETRFVEDDPSECVSHLLCVPLGRVHVDVPALPCVPEECWPKLRLGEMQALETLVLFIALDDDPDEPGPAIDYMPYWQSVEILFETLPPSLREIHLGLEIVNEPRFIKRVLRDVDWRHIVRCLDKIPKFRRLKMFKEYRWRNDLCDPLEDYIKDILHKKLASLESRGILDLEPYKMPPLPPVKPIN